MIDLYTWTTPNGFKAAIMLEETGLPYEVHPINIMENDQFDPDYLKINPNNKIPTIVDRDTGRSVMESGAILLYLAEKSGTLMPQGEDGRWRAMEWLMWQMGGFGPMLGQAHHFLHFNQGKAPYAEERYAKEVKRLYGVMDTRLGEAAYLAGDDYSVADIATFPWSNSYAWQGIDLHDYPNVLRWFRAIAARPAVQKGYTIPAEREINVP